MLVGTQMLLWGGIEEDENLSENECEADFLR